MITELIRRSRDEVYCNTGIMPQYLYLGPQAYKDLIDEAEKYLEPRKDRAFPELIPVPVKSPSPPPEKFMDMTIVERADWPSLMIVLAHTPVPDCFEPEELIASLKNPKERRTVH